MIFKKLFCHQSFVSTQYFMVILGVQCLYALQIVQSIKGLHSLPSFIEGIQSFCLFFFAKPLRLGAFA